MTQPRAEEAQRLVDEGRVNIVMHWNHAIEAEVEGEQMLYAVFLYDNGHYSCTCNWGSYRSHTDDLCAHALAVQMVVEKEGVK